MRCNLRKLDSEDELGVPQIKAKTEITLEWISPMAMNTLIAHQGFGWVREWANSSKKTGKWTHHTAADTLSCQKGEDRGLHHHTHNTVTQAD